MGKSVSYCGRGGEKRFGIDYRLHRQFPARKERATWGLSEEEKRKGRKRELTSSRINCCGVGRDIAPL